MIKSNRGEIAIVGPQIILCAELSSLVHEMNRLFTEKIGEEEAKKTIMLAVERGFEPIEKIKAENEECKEEIAELFSMLADVLRGKEDKGNGSEQ